MKALGERRLGWSVDARSRSSSACRSSSTSASCCSRRSCSRSRNPRARRSCGWRFRSPPGSRPRTGSCRRIPGRSRPSSGSAPTPARCSSTRSSSACRAPSWPGRSSRRWLGDRVRPQPGGLAAQFAGAAAPHPPGFASTVFVILLPVLLMLVGTVAGRIVRRRRSRAMPACSSAARWWRCSSPTLVALRVFGTACGFDRATLLRFSDECVGPIAGVLLVVGAGGGFGRVLDEAGVARAIAESESGRSPSRRSLLGWSIAALLRVAVGSATVAITTIGEHAGAGGGGHARAPTRRCSSWRWAPARSSPRTSTTAASGW